MNSKEALERLGNVEVAVTTIRSGITHFERLKDYYETEFEVLEKELLFVRDIKPFDVYEEQYKKLEKENHVLRYERGRFADSMLKDYNENIKLKKALDILKNGFEVILCENNFPISEIKYSIGFKLNNDGVWIHISQEDYELLKDVLEDD